MNYSKYNRHTAILDITCPEGLQPEKFTANHDMKLAGHIRIETGNGRGVLHCTAKNLRTYEKSDYIYKLILLGEKDGKVIYANCGTLSVNRRSNAEITYEFDPHNVHGGNALHEFSTAVIAAICTVDAEEDMHPVIFGALPALKENEKAPVPVDVPAFFRGETADSKGHETQKTATCEKTSHRDESYNSYYSDFIKTACVHLQKVSDIYEQVFPFGEETGTIKWYKVLNIMSIPFVNTTCHFAATDYYRTIKQKEGFTYPSCQDLAARYRHFLFGIKEAHGDEREPVQKYYFAIPGMYCKEEQPDGGKSGFRYWQPLSGGSREKSTYGYWIAAINASSGNIEEIPV